MNDPHFGGAVTFAAGLSWTRVRTPRLLSRIGKAFFFIGGLGALALVFSFPTAFGIASVIGIFAWPLFIVSYILTLTQTSFTGLLEASASELVLLGGGKSRRIPIERIAGVLVVEREVAGALMPTAEIELTNGDRLTARMADSAAPYALKRALGFGAGGKRVFATLTKPTRRLLHPVVGVACYIAGLAALMLTASFGSGPGSGFDQVILAYPLVTFLLYQLVARLGRAPVVTVGDDGVVVRGVRGDRFIPRRDIALAASSQDGALVIEDRAGNRTAVAGLMLDAPRVAAVLRLVQHAASTATTAQRFTHYERGGRDLVAWRDHLAHAMNDTSYRHNAATVDDAAAVLRSAEATAEQRVGAALALRVAGQPPERIRVAAASAADERMREALEAVADGGDDLVIEKKLKRLQP